MNFTIKKNGLKRLEQVFLILGVSLIALYFGVMAWAEVQRQSSIEAFTSEIKTKLSLADNESTNARLITDAVPASTVSDLGVTKIPEPDKSDWDDNRIVEYEASLKVDSSLPDAVLSISKIDLIVPVFDGTSDFNLNRGIGRIRGTSRIDANGNLGLAGHRDGFFRGLKDIVVGDTIALQTRQNLTEYQVSSIEIVNPEDVSVLAPTDHQSITLVTCYPFYFIGHAPQRYIVKADAL